MKLSEKILQEIGENKSELAEKIKKIIQEHKTPQQISLGTKFKGSDSIEMFVYRKHDTKPKTWWCKGVNVNIGTIAYLESFIQKNLT